MLLKDLFEYEESPFVKSIVKSLKDFAESNKDDIESWCKENDYAHYDGVNAISQSFIGMIKQKEQEGWSKEDTLAFFKSTEEIDPRISEDRALARMKKISDKYKK